MKLLVKKVEDKSIFLGVNHLTGLPASPARNIKFDLFIDGSFIGTASMFGFDLRTRIIKGSFSKGVLDAIPKYMKKHRNKLLDINRRKSFNLPEFIRYW